MSKKLFSKFIVLLLVVGLLFVVSPTMQAQAQGPSVWDGNYPTDKPLDMPAVDGGVQEVNTAAQFAWLSRQADMFPAGVTTVKLMVDIDLDNHLWTPSGGLASGSAATGNIFDGNGHTISNLNAGQITIGASKFSALFAGSNTAGPIIQNLLIDGATAEATDAYSYAAVVVAASDFAGDFINITVKDAVVKATKYAGGISTYSSSYDGGANFTNCAVEGLTIEVQEMLAGTAVDKPHVGGILGYMNEGKFSGNSVTNLSITVHPVAGQPVATERVGVLIGTAQANVLVGTYDISNVTYNTAPYTKIIGLDVRAYKVVNTTQMLGYTTIQAAIDAAADGNVIEVGPGTYNEGLLINKPLTVKSTDGAATTIISKDIIYVVVIRASNVTFDGFTVKSPGYNAPGADLGGIMIGYYGDNNLTTIVVKNNIVTEIGASGRVVSASDYPSVGIVVNAVIDGLQITGNTIHDLTQVVNDNAVTWGPSGIGFYGYDSTPLSKNVVISGNTVYNIASTGTGTGAISNGIRAGWGSGDVTISGNTVHDIEGRAIAVTSANNGAATITNNTLSNAATGIYLWNTGGGVLSGNTFTNVGVEVERLQVHNVTQSKYYETIQAALNAAITDDVIEVGAGTYTENLNITTPLTLQSTDWAGKIVGDINIKSSNVTVQGLDISHPGFVTCINLSNDQVATGEPRLTLSNISILNNKIHDVGGYAGGNTKAIKAAHGPDNVTIEGNQFYNITNTVTGGTKTRHTDAISFGDSSATDPSVGVVIRNNTFVNITSARDQANAISFNNNTGVTAIIENNTFEMDTIRGNTLGTLIGLEREVPGIEVRGNTFQATNPANIASNTHAIYTPRSDTVIEKNKFLTTGKMVTAGYSTVVDVTGNWWGQATGPSAGQTVYRLVDTNPWCANAECTEFLPATVTIAPVTPVVCGNVTTSTIDIMAAGIPASTPLQGYQFRLNFDETKTNVANLATDIVNGGFILNGGYLVATWIDETTGAISTTPTGILDIGYTQFTPSASSGDGKLASITLTHVGVPGDIDFTLTDVSLSSRDGFVIPAEASATATTLTLSPAVLNITKVPNVGYCDLASAVLAASAGDTLQLQADITIPTMVKVTKALTLDLNGKTATVAAGKTALSVDTEAGAIGALIITDSTTGGLGKITGGARAVQVLNGASLVLNKGTLDGTTSDGVFVKTGSSVTVNGGTVTGLYFAIAGNGSAGQGGTTINITGGSLSSQYTAIYHPQAGTLNISGDAAISGHTGIEMRSGTLNISGTPTITTWGGFVANPGKVDGGSVESGDAILVYTHTDYAGEMVINISGGTFTSATGYALREYVADAFAASDVTSLTVTGGKFYGGLDAGEAGAAVTFSTELTALQLPELALKGGLYNTNPASPTVFVFVPYGTVYNTAQAMYEIVGISLNVNDFYYNNSGTLRGVSTDFYATNFLFSEASSVVVRLYSGVEGVYVLQQTNVLKVPSSHNTDVLTSSFDYFGTYVSNSWANTEASTFDVTAVPTRVEVTVVLPGGTLEGFKNLPTGDRTTILPSVSGLVTLQGILAPRAGVPIYLTSGLLVRDTTSTAMTDINYWFTGVETLTYTFTTSQPRYLNVTTASGKTFLVNRDLTLNPLRLYGGDVNQDNAITVSDTSAVGTAWGSTANPDANINYDGIVNIQDLALVGGNYGLISATAYSWVP